MEGQENNESKVDLALRASRDKFFIGAKGPSIVILLIILIVCFVFVVYIGSTTERSIAYSALGVLAFAIGSLLYTLREHVLRK